MSDVVLSATSALNRRGFVGVCVSAVACIALPACASVVTRTVPVSGDRMDIALNQYPELLTPGGYLKVMPQGSDEVVYILRRDDGSFTAISPICTHRGCTVDIAGVNLVCPCHGSTYDRAGSVLKGPAERSLYSFPLQLRDGVLSIDMKVSA
jgi:Rieske Fe-S protein